MVKALVLSKRTTASLQKGRDFFGSFRWNMLLVKGGYIHFNSLCSAYDVLYIAKVLKKLVEA